MNIPIKENIQQRPIDQQAAEQTILLNAIRNKFANSDNHSGTSPPVFSIPILKIPQFSPASTSLDSNDKDTQKSKLNNFLLGKLCESNTQTSIGAFKIPDLKIKSDIDSCPLKPTDKLNLAHQSNFLSEESRINSLNNGISNLRVHEEQKKHVIDLTTALNQKATFSESQSQQINQKNIPNIIDFQIPFIDCDLKEPSLQLPLRDEHCLTDVSDFVHRRHIIAPSKFGKITCLRYRFPKVKTFVDHSFAQKHKINRFCFDTRSPDDIVLASLRNCTKV